MIMERWYKALFIRFQNKRTGFTRRVFHATMLVKTETRILILLIQLNE